MFVIFLINGCESSMIESSNIVLPDIPDSVVSEYHNGIEFLGRYSENPHPYLRIDSAETYSNQPPSIATGTLFIYFNNEFVDSIPYGSAFHYSGVARPSTRAGFITQGNEYLLKIQNENDAPYIAGRSFWYIINSRGIHKLPSAVTKEENGIYEDNTLRVSKVRKSPLSNRIIFYSWYYCYREGYTTFDLNSTLQNFARKKVGDCYTEWEWEK